MYITVNGKRIRYEEQGRGYPIVFIHGWGGSLKSMHSLFLLAARKYYSINVELPGFGESANPDPEWGIGEYASHLTTFFQQKSLGPVTFFGHSFGGGLGIQIAAKSPRFIDKLILCASSYKRENKPSNSTKKAKNIFKKISVLQPFEPFIKKYFYKLFFPGSDLLKYPHLEPNFRKIVQQDLTPIISEIKQPSLILWGTRDNYTPIHWAYELQEKIKGSQLKVFDGATHGLPFKQPDDVYEAITEFLDT